MSQQLSAEPDTISRHHAVSKRAPRLAVNKTFTYWRKRTTGRKPKRVLTAGDRLLQAKKREQHRHDYQEALEEAHTTIRGLAEGLRNRFGKYSVDHYYNDLIHRAHKSRSVRKVSSWNAFQKLELERMKREAGDDASQINLTEVNKQISNKWKSLSPAQREDVTAESVQRIEEERKGRKLTAHSIPLNAFHDARSTIQSIETQLAQLHSRTGLEFLLVACRSTVEDFIKPFAYFSSDTIKGFFNSSMNRSIDDFALQLEAYVMSGIKGVVENSKTRTLELKKRTTALVVEKLRAITGKTTLRMQYDRFDDLITQKYGIIIKNWPLKRFCNPSAVATRIELEVLFNSWESGATQFQKLSPDEMRTWQNERLSSQLAMMSLPPPPTSNPVAPSPTTPNPIPLVPFVSAQSPELAPPSPTQPEMVLLSELTERPASNNTGEGAAPILPSTTQLPSPNSELVAEMVRLDPTLQSIDPALIMVGLVQGCHRSETVDTVANLNGSPLPAPLAPQKKRNRGAFEVFTPETYNERAKKPRKEQKGKRVKKNATATGRENIPPAEGIA